MDAAGTVEAFLRDRRIEFAGELGVWSLSLAGESKRTIPIALALTTGGLRVESFFLRAPQENAGDVYRLLLGRNARARHVWFAVDGLGDVYLLGFVPAGAIADDALDELFGEILATADDVFSAAIERGFASYLAADLAWRAKQEPPDRS